MAEISELPLPIRLFVRAYPWQRIDPVPAAPLLQPLRESRVALVSTAGLVLPDQVPFDDELKGGDASFREMPGHLDVATLVDAHRSQSYDHGPLQADPNLGFPLDRLRELAADGRIGALNDRHFSLMGSITRPGRLIHESAPAVADALVHDGVDAALLVPV